ncbi:hypothetical protein ACH5RR_003535 [Cinchona calisaya]|uniref:Retrotransposon gag domain-containing protein n=1 Tax=Cinchona calisaya TaxID=153742 RepID=A0ABD3AV57_9GENT
MDSYEKTHRELEVEFNANQVERPYDVHDDGHESEDPKLNVPIGAFLGDACRAVRRQKDKEIVRTSLPPSNLSAMASIITQAFQTVIQQSLGQPAQHPQPLPTCHEKDVEECFVPEPLKPQVVTHFLEEKTKAWWKGVSLTLTINGIVTWDRFRQAFMKHCFPPTLIAQKQREFTMLKQKPGMSITEYSHQFHVLGSYAPTIMNDPTEKMIFFRDGFLSEI